MCWTGKTSKQQQHKTTPHTHTCTHIYVLSTFYRLFNDYIYQASYLKIMNPAKSIPSFTKFYSVISYAFPVMLHKLVVFPSCTLYSESQGIRKLTSWLWVTQ